MCYSSFATIRRCGLVDETRVNTVLFTMPGKGREGVWLYCGSYVFRLHKWHAKRTHHPFICVSICCYFLCYCSFLFSSCTRHWCSWEHIPHNNIDKYLFPIHVFCGFAHIHALNLASLRLHLQPAQNGETQENSIIANEIEMDGNRHIITLRIRRAESRTRCKPYWFVCICIYAARWMCGEALCGHNNLLR